MNPLASVDDLRRLTGQPWSDLLDAGRALAAASATVRTYVGWSITAEDHVTATIDSDGGHLLAVPSLHLTDVHEVRVDGQPVTDYTWSASGVLHRPARWPRGFRRVSVTYSGGYDTPPAELAAVVCGLADRQSRPAGIAGMTVGAQTVTFTGDAGPGLSAVDEAILDRYRIVPGD